MSFKKLLLGKKEQQALLRKRAEVFATLANVADLSSLEPWQKQKLVADALKSGLLHPLTIKNTVKAKRFAASSMKKTNTPIEWLALTAIHPRAYRFINQLLDKNRADVGELQKKITQPRTVVLTGDITAVIYESATVEAALCRELFETITRGPVFPFRRCPICRTIFLVSGKKKFCDSKCTARAIGPRTEYMRDYMREKRKAG